MSSKLPKVTKLVEGRAAIKTKMFKCEPQTVIASIDIEKKKGNRRNSVFSRTQDLSFTYKCQAQQSIQ